MVTADGNKEIVTVYTEHGVYKMIKGAHLLNRQELPSILKRIMNYIDSKLIRPIFGGRKSTEYVQFLENCYENPIVMLEISSICNFTCDYCVSKLNLRKKMFMPQDLFEHVALQVPAISSLPLRLHIDGEPTLHPQFHNFGLFLNHHKIPFVLATNGSRLTPTFLDLEMDVVISISTNAQELKRRALDLNHSEYLNRVVTYLEGWLSSDSQQTIFIQIAHDHTLPKKEQVLTREKFIAEICDSLNLMNRTEQVAASGDIDAKYQYFKDNGRYLCFYTWHINHAVIYQGPKDKDRSTNRGFCSAPWQELAILADGRASFCCRDLTGGTAYTDNSDIWNVPLKEIWSDKRIAAIRKTLLKQAVTLPVCRRCLVGFHNYSLHNSHPVEASTTA